MPQFIGNLESFPPPTNPAAQGGIRWNGTGYIVADEYTKLQVDSLIAAIPLPDLSLYAALSGADFTGIVAATNILSDDGIVIGDDTRILRSGTKALTVDDAFSGPVNLSVTGNLVVVGSITAGSVTPFILGSNELRVGSTGAKIQDNSGSGIRFTGQGVFTGALAAPSLALSITPLALSSGGIGINTIAANKLLGATTADSISAITLGSNLSITSGTLNAAGLVTADAAAQISLPGAYAGNPGQIQFNNSGVLAPTPVLAYNNGHLHYAGTGNFYIWGARPIRFMNNGNNVGVNVYGDTTGNLQVGGGLTATGTIATTGNALTVNSGSGTQTFTLGDGTLTKSSGAGWSFSSGITVSQNVAVPDIYINKVYNKTTSNQVVQINAGRWLGNVAGALVTDDGTTDFQTGSGKFNGALVATGNVSGTWNGTVIGAAKGGTGLTTIAANKLLYASATDTYAPLTLGTNLSITSGTLNAAGAGTPAGSGTEIQYRSGSSFGAITGSSTTSGSIGLTSYLRVITSAVDAVSSTGVGTFQGVDAYGQTLVLQSPVSSYNGNILFCFKAIGGNGQALLCGTKFTSDIPQYWNWVNSNLIDRMRLMADGTLLVSKAATTAQAFLGSDDGFHALQVIGGIKGTSITLGGTFAGTALAGVAFLANYGGTPPTPAGGGRLFVDAGNLKYVGSSGTVTTLAAA